MRRFTLFYPTKEAEIRYYYDLRWQLLRAPWKQPRGSERDDLEASPSTRHVAARMGVEQVVGVGRLHLNNQQQAQIRYMAVAEPCRGLGIGRALAEELERAAEELAASQIVLNAREDVVCFYQKLGYAVIGPGPTMFGSIRHQQMIKQIAGDTDE